MTKVHCAVTARCMQVPVIRSTLLGKVFLQNPNNTEQIPQNLIKHMKFAVVPTPMRAILSRLGGGPTIEDCD